eukprot:CAMPEP_0115154048 /NCGR_PEP_ID=MMETSP0227-20121206/67066_1 /TAXON_ID=89957 /ORGANISM="Polarella glacialis, Strain CCMP 1383" /LENGTH=127 /DNA_ID=CAMNT_0002564857 /DNA_START=634 /DNA_END=1016 /DNA_ORIENTATION=-
MFKGWNSPDLAMIAPSAIRKNSSMLGSSLYDTVAMAQIMVAVKLRISSMERRATVGHELWVVVASRGKCPGDHGKLGGSKLLQSHHAGPEGDSPLLAHWEGQLGKCPVDDGKLLAGELLYSFQGLAD